MQQLRVRDVMTRDVTTLKQNEVQCMLLDEQRRMDNNQRIQPKLFCRLLDSLAERDGFEPREPLVVP